MPDDMEGAHRRVSLLEVMSAVDGGKNSLAGLTLEEVLNSTHRSQIELPPVRPSRSKTLLDIIKDEEPNRDRRTWKQLRYMFRPKHAGAAWISTVQIPPSNNLIGNDRVLNSVPDVPISGQSPDSRRSSVNPLDLDDTDQPCTARRLLGEALAEERRLFAREAVAAQEAAETEAATIGEDDQPVSMSLMELMGGDGEEESENEEVRDVAVVEEMDGGIEQTCCVCMVRQKGAAFIPCGHTFCRVCSKELYVERGTCPICNNFIVEVLDIF